MSTLHEKLLETRKEIYERLKKSAIEYNSQMSEDLAKYYEAQEEYADVDFSSVSIEAFLKKAKSSQLIFLGDFHTFDQSSKNLHRLMKALVDEDKQLALGLEMVSFENQGEVNAFLNNDITEKEFLESINYKESWRFPWGHYRELFEFAKENR